MRFSKGTNIVNYKCTESYRGIDKISLMRTLMHEIADYNWTFCYSRSDRMIEDTFKDDFPIAYEKIMRGEIKITKDDMR